MALLRGLPLAMALLLVSAQARSTSGRVDLELYDRPVRCDIRTEQCHEPGPDAYIVVPEDLSVRAFISTQASRHAPHGVYLYLEIWRPGGAVALVEVDLSTRGSDSFLSFKEYRGDALVFSSTAAIGTVEVPADLLGESAPICPCRDGRLELLFFDPGPDGAQDGVDDQYRRISRARYSIDPRGACLSARMLEVIHQVRVQPVKECPSALLQELGADSDSAHYSDSNISYDIETGCYAEGPVYDEEDTGCGYEPEPEEGYYDQEYEETGCGGDVADEDYEDTGCEGDTSGSGWGDTSGSGCEGGGSEWGDSSGSGCEGGSSDCGDSSSSGCEGDSSSGSASCEGDAYAAAGLPSRRIKKRNRIIGMLGPLSLLGLFCAVLKRGKRARRRRR